MTKAKKAIPVSVLVGRRVRELRESAGKGQDEMARHLRRLGLNLTRSQVGKLERGERGVTLPELVTLARYFGIALAELIEDGETMVELTPTSSVELAHLKEILGGAVPSLRYSDTPFQREDLPQLKQAIRGLRRRWKGITAAEYFRATETAAADVVVKAAARLEVEPFDLALASLRTFGRSLVEERDRRLEGKEPSDRRSLQAARGHVTRRLLEELGPMLKKGAGR